MRRKLELWLSLPDEVKARAVRDVMEYFRRRAGENPLAAWAEFSAWLKSEDGAVMWPWLWKPEYREVMIDIAVNYIRIVEAVLAKDKS